MTLDCASLPVVDRRFSASAACRLDDTTYNEEGGGDAYCMSAAKFEAMYEPDE
jgi:hypothetical protein